MYWFEKLTGFPEPNYSEVRNHLEVIDGYLISKVNGKKYYIGELQIPTLKALKSEVANFPKEKGTLRLTEIVGNAQDLHKDPSHNGAMFQVASQFNLLEMVGPEISPENGVSRYAEDYTQGPACAIACGAATIYRNYFVPLNGQIGQTRQHQIDCMDEMGEILDNSENRLWTMKNGYLLSDENGLFEIDNHLNQISSEEYQTLKEALKIGVQWDAEVTIANDQQRVSQVFCSALPIGYSHVSPDHWESFAKLILDATYEATFYASLLNFFKTGNNQLFLTLVGGGAFRNNMFWIIDAIRKAATKFKDAPLDVKIVSFGSSKQMVQHLVNEFKL